MSANLIPMARRRAIARDDRMAAWAAGVAVYAALLGVLWLGSRQWMMGGASNLERRLGALETERGGVEVSIQDLRTKIGRTQGLLMTARSIADHPDWSVLLSLIASLRGNDIEIEKVALGPRRTEAKSGTTKPTRGVWLKLSGVGKDHQAIAQFALRMENAALFDRVGLADARKSPSGAEDGLVGFEIEAFIEEQTGGGK